ncbi:efflux RND transporter periplasmic adaptor subunit [Pelagicoccus mobilis]|uniref:Efflux RND transporter periplasmic adaptor subunit n=1 Tax=Pelagicoccus mobilis TaxID=415221 RepID=A0A934VPS5_9BACT|nr:efflux RND transporter periplasmic adaptor subunit [Pelagicoccus mobilis]MBK1877597.1 efflux RND transporter periplasmic adaptor subunit [Pelagicoccus mobilis]
MNIPPLLIVPVLVSLPSLFLVGCGSNEVAVAEEEYVRPVKLIELKAAESRLVRRYPATIKAATSRKLSFSVGGLVVDLPVSEAQRVKEGEVIARLEGRTFQNQVDSARAQYENAEDEYQRAVRLSRENAIAKSALEQRKVQRDVAKAQLDSAEKSLSDSILRSPMTGVITSVFASTLQNIGPGEPVATVISNETLQASVNYPANLMVQSVNRTDRKALVMLDVEPDHPIEAKFKEANLEADTETQTFELTYTFDSPDGLLILPGMSATMELSSTDAESSKISGVAIPLTSVLSEASQTFVWVVDPETKAVSKREVRIKDEVGEELIVIEGLKVGETIAAAGVSYLSEGMKVRPWTSQ